MISCPSTQTRALLGKIQSAQEAVEANEALAVELSREYESFRPIFARQRNTLDTLSTLALLQQGILCQPKRWLCAGHLC